MQNPWIIPNRLDVRGNPVPVDNSLKAKTIAFINRDTVKTTALGAAYVAAATIVTGVASGSPAAWTFATAGINAAFYLTAQAAYCIVESFFEKQAIIGLRRYKKDLTEITLDTKPTLIIEPDGNVQNACDKLSFNVVSLGFALLPFVVPAREAAEGRPFVAPLIISSLFAFPPLHRVYKRGQRYHRVEAGEYALVGYDPDPKDLYAPEPVKKSRFLAGIKKLLPQNKPT